MYRKPTLYIALRDITRRTRWSRKNDLRSLNGAETRPFSRFPDESRNRCSNGTRTGEGDNRQNFLVSLSLSVSFSLETLIGPNSRDQTLFRLFVSRREIDRGRISWLAISWCTKLREADSYRSFTGTSTMLVDYSYTFLFYNLLIQNARWSTLRTFERSRV